MAHAIPCPVMTAGPPITAANTDPRGLKEKFVSVSMPTDYADARVHPPGGRADLRSRLAHVITRICVKRQGTWGGDE